MTVIYLVVLNVFFDANTLRIVIIVNLTNKVFTFNKSIYLGIIHEYIDIFYIIIDFTKAFIAIITTSIIVFELFIIIQKEVVFGFRYQRISLVLISFENNILAINVEFIFILKTKVILIAKYITRTNLYFDSEFILYINNLLKLTFSISISNIIYTIITDII